LDAKGDEKMTLIEMKKYDNTPIILGEKWA
jgi:hypothetical protein